jgi:hypothetical protein
MIFYAVIIQTQLHHVTMVAARITITQQRLVQFPLSDRHCKNSDYGDAIQTFERLYPEDIGRDMAFLVGIIEILLRKFFLPSHNMLGKVPNQFYRYRWIRNAIYTCWQ